MITPMLNVERQTEALGNAQRHWQEKPQASRPVKLAWSVALTREAGTDGAAIASEVGRRLGWPVYDRNLIEKIAGEMGLRTHLLDSVDERRKHWLLECVEAMTAAGPVSEARFVRRLSETLLSLGAIGHCVLVGRGAAQLLSPESTLRVRLVASRESRIAAVQRGQHISVQEATKWVDHTDQERRQFIREHFGKDSTDCTHYDLVLNASRWSVNECADFIVDALKRAEARE